MSLAPSAARARDGIIAAYRRSVYDRIGLTLFPHQAEWQCASEGWSVLPRLPLAGEHYTRVLVPDPAAPDNPERATIQPRALIPRFGGIAHVLWDLAAFKAGKSYSAGAWATGFVPIPKAKIHFVGAAYTTSEPEFTYLCDFLLGEQGMNLTPTTYHNDAAHGRMKLAFRNGAEFEVKSWDRKEDLKGKKVTAYIFTEAYQLPGLQCYTSIKQNLRELQGYAVFPTTPDRPWVAIGHEFGHGADLDWHCTCGVGAEQNPHTFSAVDKERDRKIMTKEKFAISWEGKLGDYVGQVYSYQRGQQLFTPMTHSTLFRPELSDASAH